MKLLTAVIVLGCAACLAGCQSLVDRFEASVAHMAGGITQQDAKQEVFQQRMAEARTPVILLQCRVATYRDTERSYFTDENAGCTRAYNILSNLTVHSQSGDRNVSAMAVVILNGGVSNMVSSVSNATMPVYVVSFDPVAGGTPMHNALASNILALASATRRGNFPFEAPHIIVNSDDKINEVEARSAPAKSDKRWITAAEANASLRAQYLQTITVEWPKLLPQQQRDFDVLYISWEEWHITAEDQRKQRLRHMPKELAGAAIQGAMHGVASAMGGGRGPQPTYRASTWQPDRNHTVFKCARISAQHNLVYYCKSYHFNSVGEVECVERELTRMNTLANQSSSVRK